VREALAGGPNAFAPIVGRYKGAVLGVALARLGDFDDAEDVAQQVFVEAFQRLDNLKDPKRLGAWLRSIAIHRSINYLKRRKRDIELEAAHAPPISNVPRPDELLEQAETCQQVMAAIGRLSKAQRETVVLYYLGGHTQQEVAAIQDVPVGTVKFRLHAARIKLKEDMAQMVETMLRDSTPNANFSDRVLRLLDAHQGGGRMWQDDTWHALHEVGRSGVDGYKRAMELPDHRSRRAAVHYSGLLFLDQGIELVTKALADPNRKVRSAAVAHLLGAFEVDEQRGRRELVPLVLPLLFDHSRRVRFRAAGFLSRPEWISAIPLETAARALAQEQDPSTFRRMQELVLALLETVTDAQTR
jgi:RNA polymerase sigma-70 factor (ECF subfamily)